MIIIVLQIVTIQPQHSQVIGPDCNKSRGITLCILLVTKIDEQCTNRFKSRGGGGGGGSKLFP